MICKKCEADVPNEDCVFSVDGKTRATVRGPCPNCGYGELGTVKLTEEQYNAWYHDLLPVRKFRLFQLVNHSPWTP